MERGIRNLKEHGFYADFIDEAFVGREAGIIEGVTELLGEMLLMPAISGGRLRRDYVETERDNLIADIRSELNDKRSYASQRLLENMCDRERYSVPKLGRLREGQYRKLSPAEVEYLKNC